MKTPRWIEALAECRGRAWALRFGRAPACCADASIIVTDHSHMPASAR
jgi:hypothetical protein